MEKVDLLVHIQKIQLELEDAKKNQVDPKESQKKDAFIEQLQTDLAWKDSEIKNWMTKIQQADELVDDLDAKENQIEELKTNLNFETTKRKQMETMFQDLTDREKSLRQELDHFKNQKVAIFSNRKKSLNNFLTNDFTSRLNFLMTWLK